MRAPWVMSSSSWLGGVGALGADTIPTSHAGDAGQLGLADRDERQHDGVVRAGIRRGASSFTFVGAAG